MEAKEECQQVLVQAEVPMVQAPRPSLLRRKEVRVTLQLKVQAKIQEEREAQ
jgi:hypothetical protein